MQFVIIAKDGENVAEKRKEVRPLHLENMARMESKIIVAGGLLDEEGNTKGSTLILNLGTREEVDAYLETEPYVVHKVWQDIQVEPLNVVVINGQKVGK